MDCFGNLYDYYGGQEDLNANLLRTVGDPKKRFAEDALRMYRACRFVAQLDFTYVEGNDTASDVLGEYDAKEMKRGLRSVSGWLRKELGSVLDLRYTPELTFIMDDSIAHGAYINRLINDLDIKHDEDDESQ